MTAAWSVLAMAAGACLTAQVAALTPLSAALSPATFTAGSNHACAIHGGAAYCWGSNATGQLGNNSTSQSNVPVAVTTSGALSGKTLTQATAGTMFTCAADTAGAAYCWGANAADQLGNGSTSNSSVPVTVLVTSPGPPSGVTATAGDDLVDATVQLRRGHPHRLHGHRVSRQCLLLHQRHDHLHDHRADQRNGVHGHGDHARHQR